MLAPAFQGWFRRGLTEEAELFCFQTRNFRPKLVRRVKVRTTGELHYPIRTESAVLFDSASMRINNLLDAHSTGPCLDCCAGGRISWILRLSLK